MITGSAPSNAPSSRRVSDLGDVQEGQWLWAPSASWVENTKLRQYSRWAERRLRVKLPDYNALWAWSVADPEAFWSSLWDYFDVLSDAPYTRVLTQGDMMDARWFEGSRVNYAEQALRHEALATEDEAAFVHCSELRGWNSLSWRDLGRAVRKLATGLREAGVGPGDRVVSYMPNVPETAIAMLATVAVGAVWSAASPEFGAGAVIDRFGQIAPKLAFMADGYMFGGRIYDRRDEIVEIVGALTTVGTVVWLDYAGLAQPALAKVNTVNFQSLMEGEDVVREMFEFSRVPSDHPLWILYSSGTTGIPKAIVHSHVGTILEQMKVRSLQLNLSPESRSFFYTTTGWMMWNATVSSLLVGGSAVLYDGSPVAQGIDTLWKLAAESGATTVGASPTLVGSMMAKGVRPAERHDLSRVTTILMSGSPVTPDMYAWFYSDVKSDLWVVSTSGGTELCSALVGAAPGVPVYAGEMQGRQLGMDVHAWDESGQELVESVGELVVTSPFPSQPLFFWGDSGGHKYRENYFETFPGVWRHGDLIRINARGGCFIPGRSDSTLNRYGVRIGSAEIYRVVNQMPEVVDSLIVCCELPGGGFYMPLFVQTAAGAPLDADLKEKINRRLRENASPRHTPDEIHSVPAIPFTLTGKKMEAPVRRILMGVPVEQAASRDAMADPTALDWFITFARQRAEAADLGRAYGPATR